MKMDPFHSGHFKLSKQELIMTTFHFQSSGIVHGMKPLLILSFV